MLGQALVNTLWLILPAEAFALILGVGLGLFAAWRRGKAADIAAVTFSLFMWALPIFFLGIILLIAGANWFGLPAGGRITIGAEFASVFDLAWDVGRHLLLPTLTLGLALLGEYMLIMRSSVLDVFGEDYILTARAKGLSTYRIIRHHALRNAMLPMVTLIALTLGFTVAGAIQVEAVFSWPGLGAADRRRGGRPRLPGAPGRLSPAGGVRRDRQPCRRARLRLARPAGSRGVSRWR